MKFLTILSLGIVGVLCAPVDEDRISAIAAQRALPALEREEVHDKFGQFALRYVTAEGIVVSERGWLVPTLDGTDYVLVTEGETSYIGDDGNVYTYKFRAGVDGYHVEGNHLPQPPKPESVPAYAPESAPESVPEYAPESAPEYVPESAQKSAPESVPEPLSN